LGGKRGQNEEKEERRRKMEVGYLMTLSIYQTIYLEQEMTTIDGEGWYERVVTEISTNFRVQTIQYSGMTPRGLVDAYHMASYPRI
jgi:hypothetical protein